MMRASTFVLAAWLAFCLLFAAFHAGKISATVECIESRIGGMKK